MRSPESLLSLVRGVREEVNELTEKLDGLERQAGPLKIRQAKQTELLYELLSDLKRSLLEERP